MQITTSSHKITHIGDTRSAFCKCTTQFEVAMQPIFYTPPVVIIAKHSRDINNLLFFHLDH